MYLIECRGHYVKAIDGDPSVCTTEVRAEAARFATEAEARGWAPGVFAKAMLADVEIVAERTPGSPDGVRGIVTPLDRAIARGERWTNREDADESLFGIH